MYCVYYITCQNYMSKGLKNERLGCKKAIYFSSRYSEKVLIASNFGRIIIGFLGT